MNECAFIFFKFIMHDSQCANPLKPLNFKLLNKKALSFEQ